MIKMPKIFSSDALYLHSSILELRGECDADARVTAEISRSGAVFSTAEVMSAADGTFAVIVKTPPASFDEYRITLRTESDEYSFDGVLFGELWLVSGQSNMSMANSQQPEWEEGMSKRICGKNIRAFDSPRLAASNSFPIDPVTDTDGWWVRAEDTKRMSVVSALATAFSCDLYEYFAQKGDAIPVGFLNCARGGVPLVTWLPSSAFERFPRIAYKAQQRRERWNTEGAANYQQPCAHYNYNAHSHLGVKTRGMLWYQGENDTRSEQTEHIYEELMIALRESYRELFAPSADEPFPCISSQIYPWSYGDFAECRVGYINRCFSNLGRKYPESFPFVPVCDLSPIWSYHLGNHPIHPAHKYALGSRFALLAENVSYGRSVKNVQKLPALLKSCVRHGNVLRLTFEGVGSGLYIKGKSIKGLYIRSKNGVYTPAKCEIVSKNVMNVYHPYIERPEHVAYAVSSYETETNLFAGEFPVAPFCTDFTDENGKAQISIKPWLSNDNDSEFIYNLPFTETHRNVFATPVFEPLRGSYIAYDRAFSLSGRSLHIYGDPKGFGARIIARQYTTLDLYNYRSLKVGVYNYKENEAKLTVSYKEENGKAVTFVLTGELTRELAFGWGEITFDLSLLPVGAVECMDFKFTHTASRTPFVKLDSIELVPKP